MFTVVDGILSVIFVAFALLGIVKGFFSAVSKPIRVIAAIAITFVIASPIIEQWTGPFFKALLYEDIYEYLVLNLSEVATEDAISSLPLVLKMFALFSGLDLGSGAELSAEQVIATLSESLAASIGDFVALIVTYLGLYIIISILLALIISILNKMFSKGIFGVINRILGFVLGGSIGVLFCCLIASIISGVSPDFLGGFVYDFFKNFSPIDFILSF